MKIRNRVVIAAAGLVASFPAAAAGRECYTTSQQVTGEDGRPVVARLQTCRTDSGAWESVVLADAGCPPPEPPASLPAMPSFEQLEAAAVRLEAFRPEVESQLACLNDRIGATSDPEARAMLRGQYYQADRQLLELTRALKTRYSKHVERVTGDRAAPEPELLRVWVAGRPHPQHPDVVAGQEPGRWTPAAGFRWRSESAMTVAWQPGLPHPLQEAIVSGPAPSVWQVKEHAGATPTRDDSKVLVPSVAEAAERSYCALLEQTVERVRTDFEELKGAIVGNGLTIFDGRQSAHTKTMHDPVWQLHPGHCQVWDLDDPSYVDEYACHWRADSVESLNSAWQALHGLVSACLAPEQYACYTPPVRNGRTLCYTPRSPGRPFLQWAQRAGDASGELVLFNHLTIGVAR